MVKSESGLLFMDRLAMAERNIRDEGKSAYIKIVYRDIPLLSASLVIPPLYTLYCEL